MRGKISKEGKRAIRHLRRHKQWLRVHSGMAIGLSILLLGMVNYLSYRHYKRADWSELQYYSLSDRTLRMLEGVPQPLQIINFVTREHEHYRDIRNLLKEYVYACPLIEVEHVDPNRELSRAEELAKRVEVIPDTVLFDFKGRTRYIKLEDLIEEAYDPTALSEGPIPIAFKGEQIFSSAIHSVTVSKQPVLYFLSGHGERSIDDYDRKHGYSSVAKQIRRDFIKLKTLSLAESYAIPEDCDALVIAGPTKKLSQPELDILRRYLEQNGRLLILLDAHTRSGLGSVLEDWGVSIADDVVVQANRTWVSGGLLVGDYGVHPITHGLEGIATIMYQPRSVFPIADAESTNQTSADRPRVSVLATSTSQGWADVDMDQEPKNFDPERDRAGPVPVAVAIERGLVEKLDMQLQPTRMVIVGDSDFITNGNITYVGNRDLFLNSLNWLIERETVMGISPKPIEEMRLVLSQSELFLLAGIVVLGLPSCVAFLGLAVWMKRRV